jgi:hypothetical protein
VPKHVVVTYVINIIYIYPPDSCVSRYTPILVYKDTTGMTNHMIMTVLHFQIILRLTLSPLLLKPKDASVLINYRVHLRDVYRDKSTFVLLSQSIKARFEAEQTSEKILYCISVVAFKCFRQ